MKSVRFLVICLIMFLSMSLFAQAADSNNLITLKGKIPENFKSAQKIRIIAKKWQPHEEQTTENYEKSNWRFISQVNPEKDGTYTFRNLQPGKYYLLMFADDRREISKTFELSKDKTPQIELLKQDAILTINVLDADKHPVSGALCNCMSDLEIPFNSESGKNTTDKNGRIKFKKIPNGLYSVFVMKDGFLPITKDDIKIDQNKNGSVEINLQKSGIVNFVYEDSAKSAIEKPLVILYCTAKDIDTNKFYKVKIFNSESNRLNVYLRLPEDFKNKNLFTEKHLNLPQGRYILEYQIFQYGKQKGTKVENPAFTGSAKVDVKTGQTTDLIIKKN